MQQQAGDGSDLAEIIIDFEKKDIKILDPIKKSKIRNSDLDFGIKFLLVLIISYLFLLVYFNNLNVNFILFLQSFSFTIYLLFVLATPIRKKLHKLNQTIFNDFFKTKKFMIVKNIKTKEWKLPYEFKNVKLEYKLFGDYKKIKKIHIKPKDYYLKRGKKIEKQITEWDAIFTFKKKLKKGRMEIEWI